MVLFVSWLLYLLLFASLAACWFGFAYWVVVDMLGLDAGFGCMLVFVYVLVFVCDVLCFIIFLVSF